MDKKILVVDDDKKIVTLVALYLKNEGYQVLAAYDGEEAIDLYNRCLPDLIVLDLMLPKISGIEVCTILREKSDTPIIMLTARTTEEDKLLGLNIGADDYVTKPFSPRELVARVGVVLRRSSEQKPVRLSLAAFGSLSINFVRHEVCLDNQAVNLTPTEYRLFEVLSREPGRCFSRKELIESVFGYDYDGLERTVDVHMMNLRRKIKTAPHDRQLIVTVPGYGYRFEDENVA